MNATCTLAEPDLAQDPTLRVKQMRWEADGVVSLELERLDGRELPSWSPGAHIDVDLSDGLGGAAVRQYSLCGPLGERRSWTIAVLRASDTGTSTAYPRTGQARKHS